MLTLSQCGDNCHAALWPGLREDASSTAWPPKHLSPRSRGSEEHPRSQPTWEVGGRARRHWWPETVQHTACAGQPGGSGPASDQAPAMALRPSSVPHELPPTSDLDSDSGTLIPSAPCGSSNVPDFCLFWSKGSEEAWTTQEAPSNSGRASPHTVLGRDFLSFQRRRSGGEALKPPPGLLISRKLPSYSPA